MNGNLWKKFKRDVLRKTGDLRSLNSAVQTLIRENSDEDSIHKGFEKIKVDMKPISSSQVIPVRPSVRTSSAGMIRKMRDRRIGAKSLSR